jgi:hypothetical protein
MAKSRCSKGTRKCIHTRTCVKPSATKRRLGRCPKGSRSCVDKKCHKKNHKRYSRSH